MRRNHLVFLMMLLLFGVFLGWTAGAAAQVNTADLSGTVYDPSGGVVKAATVTVTNLSTGASRETTTDDSGRYSFTLLPPGRYKLTVSGGPNFAALENPELVLTIGAAANFDAHLQLRGVEQVVQVTESTAPIETTKTDVSQTVDERRIDNLPINGRNYINFTLTNSQTNRDAAPSIGAAPSSGLNMGGQRGRSNEVSVDGADAVDNSVNGIRATVSQEAVQEFQLILSNYSAEYGRATGGVVNIVTKSGSNDVHGNIFGFLRHKDIQARNPFSVEVDPSGSLVPVKQAYTRVQAGATLGGPIVRDKSFYFFSYETTRRQETGFTSIGENNFGLTPQTYPFFPAPLLLTPAQANAVNQLLATGVPALQNLAAQYAVLMGSASNVALSGIDFGAVATGFGFPNPGPGPRFPIPVPCPSSATQPIGTVTCTPSGFGLARLPASFVPLNSLRGNYPISEGTSLWSGRLDHRWTNNNNSFLRVGVSPSLVTGIQVNAQNQNLGQNAGSRTSLQQARDLSTVFQHDTILNPTTFNQFRFQFARRGLHYGFSQLPGGSGPGVNIPGFAFFGREQFSTVDRIERRFQWTDHISLTRGSHTFKTGADINFIQLRSKKEQIFELNFGSVINFGGFSASSVSGGAFPDSVTTPGGTINLPGTTGVQSYGLGLPTTFIQGIGNSSRPFDNKAFAGFFQDSWRLTHKLTLNYGVRYDVELTPIFPAATPINIAAEKVLNVVEGIPRDFNNVSPRIGLAWDPWGNGKTVIRAGYGIFYDHPLLAVAFDAFTAEGALSTQLLSTGGAPSACFLLPGIPGGCGAGDGPTNLNGSSIFQGVLNPFIPPNVPFSLGYLPDQQRFDPKLSNSLFANQNFLTVGFPIPALPFTLPVAGDFKYAYSQQSNLTIERDLGKGLKFSIGYQFTHGLKLNRPRVINSTNPVLLTGNFAHALAAGLSFTSPITVALPTSGLGPMGGSCPAGSIGLNTPGGGSLVYASTQLPFLAQGFTGPDCTGAPVGFIGTAAAFNFFRPTGPNPSFAGPNAVGYGGLVALAQLAGFPAGPGVPIPYNSVDQQESSGNSVYHGLTVNVSKRFSRGFEFLSSYTWSHTIDDSTDLQTLLEPADNRFPQFERGNSDFDQRHRWVTSAVFQSGSAKEGSGFLRHLIADSTLAPIVEVSSGRPFSVRTGTDFRLELAASQGRASVGSPGVSSPFIPGVTFTLPSACLADDGSPFSIPGISPPLGCNGNLGRNTFVRPGFFQWDLRYSRRFPLGERIKFDFIVDMFNLFNRFNVADVSVLCNPLDPAGCNAGQPSAALDPRQFQFALKLSW